MEDLARGPSPELAHGVAFLCSLQRADGSIAGEVVWSPVITAQYVLVAAMIGQSIEPQRRARFLRYFQQTQTAAGGSTRKVTAMSSSPPWSMSPSGSWVSLPLTHSARKLASGCANTVGWSLSPVGGSCG